MARGPETGKTKSGKSQKSRELGFVCHMILPDGRTVPFEELTEEQRTAFRERAAQRLSARMSDYYTQHPEEYSRLPG